IRTLAEIDREARSEVVEAAGAAAAGGMVALVLAAIGLYAVVALAVNQRRREIGVRVALGARPRQVVALFFANGVRASLAGLLLGLPLSAAVLRIVASVAGVPPTNTVAVATAVALAVVTVAAVASWLPARRAARVDPLAALRGLGEGG
ncbi:MAG: FtsX-like permease family protein, partial [Gemmatimonadales bacterium]|nr:FtsX-like permease family protein [Gemmatimonadales bacterium]